MSEYSYIIGTKNNLTLIINSEIFNVSASVDGVEKYQLVVKLIKEKAALDVLYAAVSIKKQIEYISKGRVRIDNGKVFYLDKVIDSTYIGTKLLELHKNGFDCSALMLFIDNLYQNTSYRSINLLYGFLEKYNMPITSDGYFLAYKKVGADFKDLYSHSIDNSVGAVVKMNRNEIDDDPNSLCSAGLHFCSFDYISKYCSETVDAKVVILKINPKDVVSIPTDFNDAKGRCCEYTVVSVNKTVLDKNLNKPVMDYDKNDVYGTDHPDEDYDTNFKYYEDDATEE